MKKEIKKWKIEYNPELDEFFCGRLPQPKDARMFAIETGFYYYINKKGEITGVCIEYFKTIAKKWLKENKKRINKSNNHQTSSVPSPRFSGSFPTRGI